MAGMSGEDKPIVGPLPVPGTESNATMDFIKPAMRPAMGPPKPTEETTSFSEAMDIGGVDSMATTDPEAKAAKDKVQKLGRVMQSVGPTSNPMGVAGGVMSALAEGGHSWSSIGQGIKSVLGGK